MYSIIIQPHKSIMNNYIFEFNTYLSNNQPKLTLKQYFIKYHDRFVSKAYISFMDYFLYLNKHKYEYIVKQSKLNEYCIIDSDSVGIKLLVDQFDLVENKDYKYKNNNPNSYMLTPKAFKICLIKSKNSKKYVDYYLLLEEIIINYNEYEKLCRDNIIMYITSENNSLREKAVLAISIAEKLT